MLPQNCIAYAQCVWLSRRSTFFIFLLHNFSVLIVVFILFPLKVPMKWNFFPPPPFLFQKIEVYVELIHNFRI